MVKARRGLPAEFAFDVAPDAGQNTEPVRLKSYLDRQLEPSLDRAAASSGEGRGGDPRTTSPAPVVHRTVPEPVTVVQRPVQNRVLQAGSDESRLHRVHRRRSARRAPRKEFSLDADTERKMEEVVEDVSEQGPQPDATPSEVIRALVQLVHDARHRADYMHLNRRGQWGSATARAFVADLKEAFLKAIGRLYEDRYHAEQRRAAGDGRERH